MSYLQVAWTLGGGEILVILAVFLLFFGSTKLPKLARSLGSSVTEFKKGLSGQSAEPKKVDSGREREGASGGDEKEAELEKKD